MKRISFHLLALLFVLSLSLTGCSSTGNAVITKLNDADVKIKSIAICPFQEARMEDVQVKGATPSIYPALFKLETNDIDPACVITKMFEDKLLISRKWNVVSPIKTGNAFRKTTNGSIDANMQNVVKKLGQQLGVDAVLIGYLYRWQERQGVWYSVKHPASVAFEVHLYSVANGTVIWKGLFNQTQKSLTENILNIGYFVKKGGQWIAIEELVDDGIDEMIEEMP
ncbi:MAG: hypothetical protein WCJ49_03915 [Deltaproteobacteria bacterium]